MKKKPLQKFTTEYLEQCRSMTADQILEFLDNFCKLTSEPQEKCKGISLKVEPSLLEAFKTKAKFCGVPYQTQIKHLMKEWLVN